MLSVVQKKKNRNYLFTTFGMFIKFDQFSKIFRFDFIQILFVGLKNITLEPL